MRRETQYEQTLKDIESLRGNFATAASVWKNQLSKINSKYPNERFELDYEITQVLQRANVQSYASNGFSTIEVRSERTVEVPVQDSRTKHLIHMLATNLKNLSAKYPKLLT
jgi:hypothetical protein